MELKHHFLIIDVWYRVAKSMAENAWFCVEGDTFFSTAKKVKNCSISSFASSMRCFNSIKLRILLILEAETLVPKSQDKPSGFLSPIPWIFCKNNGLFSNYLNITAKLYYFDKLFYRYRGIFGRIFVSSWLSSFTVLL